MEKVIRVCIKPFCKAHFEVDKIDSEEISYPEFCPKCVGNERNVSWEDSTLSFGMAYFFYIPSPWWNWLDILFYQSLLLLP